MVVHSDYNRYNCLGMGSVHCTIQSSWSKSEKGQLPKRFSPWVWLSGIILWQWLLVTNCEKRGEMNGKSTDHEMCEWPHLSICCCLVVKPIKRQLTSSVVLKPLKIITMNQIHYAVCGPFFVNFLSLSSLWITCI